MITYPNQRVVTIFKTPCTTNFLQIDNEEWQAAASVLSYGAFKLYLYLAANMDGYAIALSPADMEEKMGLSESTYRRAFKELEGEGFLECKSGNVYWFNTGRN